MNFGWFLEDFWMTFQWFLWWLSPVFDTAGHQTRVTTSTQIIENSFKNLPKNNPNSSKINQKSIKISSWAPRSPKTPQDPSRPENREHFQHPTGHHFGRILEPCSPQEALKGHSKNILNLDWFGCPFFINFSSIWRGFWPDLGPKLVSKIH